MPASKRISPLAAVSALLAALTNVPLQTAAHQVISSLTDLPFDENDHLSSHILAYPASGPCSSLIESAMPGGANLYHHTPIAVEGDAATALFGDRLQSDVPITDVKQCPAVCLDRGVDSSLVGHPVPEKYFNPKENEEHNSFANFVGSLSCGRVEFGFINYTPSTLSLYWVNHNDEKVYHSPLERMEKNTRFIHTYIGHRFVAEDQASKKFMDHTVEFNGVIGVSNHVNTHRHRDIRSEVQSTMRGEWQKHLQVKRTFSSLGFTKGRLPDDVFASMRAYYYNNRDPPHRLQEEWTSKGLYVNHWESDCNFIQIPWDLKKIWQYRLKDVVQEWVGVEIEQTDLYGIRQYEAGARLLTHVDRITTHAVSLIVNIAQGNLSSPWTVEVYDHANRLHEVAMQPGDIVYYESAKALHGRNTPLEGGYYANVFTHYRPINDPNWYTKENPVGTPEPLIDVGKCELVGKLNAFSVGAVKCENPAIGPHLSPKMFTAESGEDLYQLWLSVGPAFDDETTTSDEL
mmetsp:Transcript_37258/g.67033  ORF Transcript_37258/g.67033 Transcript_37258/m.67033 type:complete len:516 (+) Transcript_37258:68-1615(+)|eukprot:CAMPEP_0201929172 /NCGR_PEP_ID=MMETSP0903-20130614/22445_1 /ASSEMBLY_ACC=CAM_ASM_000552 /TAXON_ID=420261 /ORGANISM="Thalassiosira antarctica, Strain CCMP982" /LENGTH=515 /DNA_ID=CAMNT_0048467873 /DNA_START=34 /DNA_END=1581 /DNA_ORIENTATION=+